MKAEIIKPQEDSKIEIVSFSLLPAMRDQLGQRVTEALGSSEYMGANHDDKWRLIANIVRDYFPTEIIDQMRTDFENKANRVYLPRNLPVIPREDLAKIRFDDVVKIDTNHHLLIGIICGAIFDMIGYQTGLEEIGAMVRKVNGEKTPPGLFWHQDITTASALAGVLNDEGAKTYFRNIPAILEELDPKSLISIRVDNGYNPNNILRGDPKIVTDRFAKHMVPGNGLKFTGEYADSARDDWEKLAKKQTYFHELQKGDAAFWLNDGSDIFHAGEYGTNAAKGPLSRVVVFVSGGNRSVRR